MTLSSTATTRSPPDHASSSSSSSSSHCQMTQNFIARKAREQLEDVLLGLQLDLELLQQEQQQCSSSSSTSKNRDSSSSSASDSAVIDALTKIKALVRLCNGTVVPLTNPVTGDTALHLACRFRYNNDDDDNGNETVAELQSSMIQIVHYFIHLFSTAVLSLENHAGQTPHDLAVAGNAPPELLECLQQLHKDEYTNEENNTSNKNENGKKKSNNKSSSSNKKDSKSNESADMASLFYSVFGRFSSSKKKNKVGVVSQQQQLKKQQQQQLKKQQQQQPKKHPQAFSSESYPYDEHGNSVLHKVFLVCRDCHKGQPPALEVVESIVRHNPDALHHCNHASETPLSLAVQCAAAASLPLIQYLVESSSSSSSCSPLERLYPRDNSIWHLLCANAQFITVEVVEYLLSVSTNSKKRLDQRNWDRDTPLHVACQTLFSTAAAAATDATAISCDTASKIIRLLVQANPRALSKTNGLYETPLHALLSSSQSCRRRGHLGQHHPQQRGQQQQRISSVPLDLIRTVVEEFPPALLYSYYFCDLPVFAALTASTAAKDDHQQQQMKEKRQYLQQATRAAAQALIEALTLYENRTNNNNNTNQTTPTRGTTEDYEVTTTMIVQPAKANAQSLLERLRDDECLSNNMMMQRQLPSSSSFAEMYDIHAQVISSTVFCSQQQQQHARSTGALDETDVESRSSSQWDDDYSLTPTTAGTGGRLDIANETTSPATPSLPLHQHQQNHWDHDVWTWMRQRGSSQATNLLSTFFLMNQAGRSYYRNDPSNVWKGVHVLEQARSTNNVTGLYLHLRENPLLCCCTSSFTTAGATSASVVV